MAAPAAAILLWPEMRTRVLTLLLALLGVAVVGWAAYQTWQLDNPLLLDEKENYGQILLLHEGRWEMFHRPGGQHSAISMVPGFHALLAGLARMADSEPPTPQTLRLFCFVLSLLCLPTAYALSRSLPIGELSLVRAAQVYFLPLVFPFHFLIYTDVLALLLALLTLLACVRRWPLTCAALGLATMLVRQTNVVFVAFLLAWSYVDAYGIELSWQRIREHAAKWWGLWACLVAFAGFVLVNGGVTLGNPFDHPLTVSHLNPRFSLICYAALFLPWLVSQWPRLPGWLRRHAWWAVAATLAALVLAFFDAPRHFWNDTLSVPIALRNHVLMWMASSWLHRLAVAGALTAALISLAMTPLVNQTATLLYSYWLLVLLPVWLVEPRYHILPLALLVLLRKPGHVMIEAALLLWFVTWSWQLQRLVFAGYLP